MNVSQQQELAASRATPVLVVDDAQDVRDLIAIVLRNAGFVVRTAGNGLEALLAAYEMKPAVIVMDVTMPVLDGIEATRLIKATEGIRESKVIAHTGNASIPALARAVVRRRSAEAIAAGSRPRGGSERSQCIVSPTPRVNWVSDTPTGMPLRALMVQQCEAR